MISTLFDNLVRKVTKKPDHEIETEKELTLGQKKDKIVELQYEDLIQWMTKSVKRLEQHCTEPLTTIELEHFLHPTKYEGTTEHAVIMESVYHKVKANTDYCAASSNKDIKRWIENGSGRTIFVYFWNSDKQKFLSQFHPDAVAFVQGATEFKIVQEHYYWTAYAGIIQGDHKLWYELGHIRYSWLETI